MAELRPYPFAALVRRMFRELETRGSIFDLPARKFVLRSPTQDYSVRFHGREASTPLGPAAGPQSQMAQNLLLSWLAGGRIAELKTVQINDTLEIPRPCIDMQTVSYNVEWSQELKLEESLEEYVKGSMLCEILAASGELALGAGFARTLFDMSVGYDLAGIRSERVLAFIHSMMDATEVVDRLRRQIPPEYARYRDLDFTTNLSSSLTLSTFHGCPPGEIEQIVDFLLKQVGMHCVIKLNPMLLGAGETRRLLNEVMGYVEVEVPDTAFERDTSWDQAMGFVDRLGETAEGVGLGLGVKFTNTLIVKNHRDFFGKSEAEMYLSGPPLHVLAMNLVDRFRAAHGDRFGISFSAGIDRTNFCDAVAVGLVPITVCSDWLEPGGYGRGQAYFAELDRRMDDVGASDIESFIIRAYGNGEAALAKVDLDEATSAACRTALTGGGDLAAAAGGAFGAWLSACKVLNTKDYVAKATTDPRYGRAKNMKLPKKIGSQLVLFDCITCDKCIPVCPNDANFSFVLPRGTVPIEKVAFDGKLWFAEPAGVLTIERKHQIANFADFCNECGNCDTFCPEDGGPYLIKPRFFGRLSDWRSMRHLDGFHLAQVQDHVIVHGRFDGNGFVVDIANEEVRYTGEGFAVQFDVDDLMGTIHGTADVVVDLTYFHIMNLVRESLLAEGATNYVAMAQDPSR